MVDRRRASDADSPLFQHHGGISNVHLNNELVEKLREKDEKVSLLEYELRRAREDITNLRSQLTNIVKKPPPLPTHSSSASFQFTSPSTPSPSTPSSPSSSSSEREVDDPLLLRFQRERIREHEVKILNYLIKNYLVQNKYSLTAITFAEEVCLSEGDGKRKDKENRQGECGGADLNATSKCEYI